jgi:hypothetical protein
MVRGLVKKSQEVEQSKARITTSTLHRTKRWMTTPQDMTPSHHTVSDQAPHIPILGQLLRRTLKASKVKVKIGPHARPNQGGVPATPLTSKR